MVAVSDSSLAPSSSSSSAWSSPRGAMADTAERFVYALVAFRGVVLAEGNNRLLQGDFARIACVQCLVSSEGAGAGAVAGAGCAGAELALEVAALASCRWTVCDCCTVRSYPGTTTRHADVSPSVAGTGSYKLLNQVPYAVDKRVSYASGRHTFHVATRGEIIYLCLAQSTTNKKLCYDFLAEVGVKMLVRSFGRFSFSHACVRCSLDCSLGYSLVCVVGCHPSSACQRRSRTH